MASKKEKYAIDQISMVYLQVIGSGATGAPKSVYVFTDHCRYLFNCGEGTQRLASEHKVKLTNMDRVFITHKSWENVGGLPGALLTLDDAGLKQLTIHGPPGVNSLYNDTRKFLRFANLQINSWNYKNNGGLFADGPIHVEAVPIWNADFLTTNSSNCSKDESADSRNLALAFICRTIPKLGTLLPERCQEFGVPKGPLLGQLKHGRDVTLPNGKVVFAKDVSKPPEIAPVFIVIEVPSKWYLESLISSEKFLKFQEENVSTENYVSVIVHFSPYEVVQTSLYQEWMGKFPKKTSHIFINERSVCLGSETVYRMQYKLNYLHPESFPLLYNSVFFCNKENILFRDDSPPKRSKILREKEEKYLNLDRNYFQAFAGLVFHIRPNLGIDLSKVIEVKPQEYIEECYKFDNFKETYEAAKKEINQINRNLKNSNLNLSKNENGISNESSKSNEITDENNKDASKNEESTYESIEECNEFQINPMELVVDNHLETDSYSNLEKLKVSDNVEDYPNVLFLGTGSCIPNKCRNTSGIVININSNSSILIDCGEGTYGQIVRLLGEVETNKLLRNLSLIYVSHLHADHHIGLIRILLARRNAFSVEDFKPIYLMAPKGIIYYLESYDHDFEDILHLFTLVNNNSFFSHKKINRNSNSVDGDMTFIDKSIGLADKNIDSEDINLTIDKNISAEDRNVDSDNVNINFEDKNIDIEDKKICSRVCNRSRNNINSDTKNSLLNHLRKVSGVKTLETCYVRHCIDAYGVAFTLENGFKLAYSGDTMPSQNFINIGLDSDILIHEATMEDTLIEDAKIKRHSTISEAMEVGVKMRAKNVILTHFSQRYTKVPIIENVPENVVVAFDSMKIRVRDFKVLRELYPVYLKMFSEDVEELSKKINKNKEKRRSRNFSTSSS